MVQATGPQKQTRWSKEKAAAVLEAQRQSGLSAQEYADREGIDCQRLHRWAQRLKADSDRAPIKFVPVSVSAESNTGSSQIEIETRSGHVVRLADVQRRHAQIRVACVGGIMLSLSSNMRIFVASAPVNMRLIFDSLAGLVQKQIGRDPMNGDLYVFFNKRADSVKILVWDRHGWSLLYKRLEKGTFRPPDATDLKANCMEIENARLAMILEGIDVRGAKVRRRWLAKKTEPA